MVELICIIYLIMIIYWFDYNIVKEAIHSFSFQEWKSILLASEIVKIQMFLETLKNID